MVGDAQRVNRNHIYGVRFLSFKYLSSSGNRGACKSFRQGRFQYPEFCMADFSGKEENKSDNPVVGNYLQ